VRSLGKYSRGEGALAKKTTSKLLKLLEKRSSDASNDDFANVATDGIDIHNVVIKTDAVRNDSNPNKPEGSEGITFSCWDFAGQEIYYNTHQFFLTGRFAHILAID
jgi:GTPase SAR1 family protein